MENAKTRTVFFISDGTGITAETLGHTLLTQFEGPKFHQVRIPFVSGTDKAAECVYEINEAEKRDGERPIVITTLVSPEMGAIVGKANALFIDFFQAFVAPLEKELGVKATHTVGRSHSLFDPQEYFNRMETINYAMAHDDGYSSQDLDKADVILVGVSRSGKTPTSLYLALQFGVMAANYPLIPEDFSRMRLPKAVTDHRKKLYGLTISPERLHQIRTARRPNSEYAALENCKYEIEMAVKLMRQEGIGWIDSTSRSIEEIAATIMAEAKLNRHAY